MALVAKCCNTKCEIYGNMSDPHIQSGWKERLPEFRTGSLSQTPSIYFLISWLFLTSSIFGEQHDKCKLPFPTASPHWMMHPVTWGHLRTLSISSQESGAHACCVYACATGFEDLWLERWLITWDWSILDWTYRNWTKHLQLGDILWHTSHIVSR